MAKTKMNYFDMNIQKLGIDFLDHKPIDDIQRDARKRIFRDMTFGNIDYSKYGNYFMEPQFLEQLIIVSHDEAINHQIKFTALREYDIHHPGDPKVTMLCSLEGRLYSAMDTIYRYLLAVKSSNYNISCLTELTSQLYQYKNDIANNY